MSAVAERRRGPSLGPWKDISDRDRRRRESYRFAMVVAPGGRKAIDCTGSGDDFAEDLANARLIAAAPDLLAILERVVEVAPRLRSEGTALLDEHVRAARKAIKKVYGL